MRKRRRKTRITGSVILGFLALAVLAGIFYFARTLAVRERNRTAFSELSEKAEDGSLQEQAEAEGPSAEGEADATEPGEISDEPQTVTEEAESGQEKEMPSRVRSGDQTFFGGYEISSDEQTVLIEGDTDILSRHALLVELDTGHIAAKKDADVTIYPASMTKILTILVAAERLEDPDALYTIPKESVEYCLTNGCSAAGFVTGEQLPVRDLFYGTILPSGGEAAVALAMYTAGSHEAFVELMNEKLQELGMAETAHMTNCVGVFDEAHFCTLRDMAMILKAAEENDFCREVLGTRVYYTTKTEQNPEGIILSNWFLRRIEDKDCHGTVAGAKTGFVSQSGDCAASYLISASGEPYICVTADTYNSWRCIYDHVAMYQLYTAS